MCGRAYKTYTEEELYFQYLTRRGLHLIDFTPIYNFCPTQNTAILRIVDGERQFDEMRWQLVPQREPVFNTRLSTINAKSETIFASRLFADLVLRQRCIVPLSGFFEWKNGVDGKRPFKIHRGDKAVMSMAGIWETWRPGTADARHSFTILTTTANRFMKEIGDRMPVILDDRALTDWLDPELQERTLLEQLLRPCPDEWLSAVEVSTLVNSAKNNSPQLLEPASSSIRKVQQPRLF
jgi:putative SOS response-associated peptidase YedK